ncbi:MAG TPA: xanthine dehydrogenase family protein molybdopterin-binding subunit, partial [Paenalcaligenes sp.]|nr:xanthine dehydrogenase family protein molybdopterin-binding subunit [Paenalcaligenes sp.]
EFALWPAAKAIWSEGAAGGAISSFDVQYSDMRIGPEGLGGGGMKPIPFEQLARKAHEMGLITGEAVHTFSRWEWARAEFDIPGFGVRDLAIDALAVRYGEGASEDLKKAHESGRLRFYQAQSRNLPSSAA